MLISSFHPYKRGEYNTTFYFFYLNLALECTQMHRLIQYTLLKCFNSFVQSTVNARRQGDENPHSGVVVETMKLLAKSLYGYQILDRSRHTITKYLNVEKAYKAIDSNFSRD